MTIPIKIIPAKEYLKQNPKPEQKEIWEVISVPWEKYIVKKIPAVEKFLENKKGKIIDVGCGSGRNMLKNKDIKYYAIDFSGKQLENAEKYACDENVDAEFFKSKADDLSMFEDEMFDYGLFIATLHCLETEKERKKALEEFYRVLKKDSEGLISVWNSDDARFNKLKGDIYMSWMEKREKYMRYYYLYNKNELIDLLKSVGFEILEEYRVEEYDRFSKKNWIIRVKK
jgi:ubiquinone/menaquinone biosynthesis C-methylase UbiE